MPTITASTSATVTVPAGLVLRGTGTGTATLGPGPQSGLQYGLDADGWVLGPWGGRSQVVYLTANTLISYTLGPETVTPSTATPSQFYLACIPGRQFVTSGVPKDLSDNACDGVLGSALTDAALWANNGYMTTAAGANINVQLPLAKSTFNLGSESVVFSVMVRKSIPAAGEIMFGNADSGSAQGFFVSFRPTTGKVRPSVNASGGFIGSLSESAAVFADGTDHVMTVAFDAVTRQIFLWRDGALSDAYAANWVGTTSPVAAFFLGAASNGTGNVCQFAGVHLLKFAGGLPINMNRIAARLAARPFDYLTDLDIIRG